MHGTCFVSVDRRRIVILELCFEIKRKGFDCARAYSYYLDLADCEPSQKEQSQTYFERVRSASGRRQDQPGLGAGHGFSDRLTYDFASGSRWRGLMVRFFGSATAAVAAAAAAPSRSRIG